MDLRQCRGELVERQEVEQLFISRIMPVKQGLLNLSRGLPPQLIHCKEEREMEAVIHQAVRAFIEPHSRPLRKELTTPAPGDPIHSVASL